MADIIQAVQWASEGNIIKRESRILWDKNERKFKSKEISPKNSKFGERDYTFAIEDMVAKDWEICEEK